METLQATDAERVVAALDKLVTLGSVDQLANHFEMLGMRGRRCCPHACLVSEYLTVFTGADVLVGSRDVSVWEGLTDVTVDLPPLVRAFVDAFDDGAFPKLVVN
jgi:hypothetical protein